jgi:hypothetical protein
LEHEELVPGVRKKLEMVTVEVSRADLDVCLSAVNWALRKI